MADLRNDVHRQFTTNQGKLNHDVFISQPIYDHEGFQTRRSDFCKLNVHCVQLNS